MCCKERTTMCQVCEKDKADGRGFKAVFLVDDGSAKEVDARKAMEILVEEFGAEKMAEMLKQVAAAQKDSAK
jgi:hypothetical protein